MGLCGIGIGRAGPIAAFGLDIRGSRAIPDYALKRGRTRGVRLGAWLAALAVLLYIVAVAMTKLVWPL